MGSWFGNDPAPTVFGGPLPVDPPSGPPSRPPSGGFWSGVLVPAIVIVVTLICLAMAVAVAIVAVSRAGESAARGVAEDYLEAVAQGRWGDAESLQCTTFTSYAGSSPADVAEALEELEWAGVYTITETTEYGGQEQSVKFEGALGDPEGYGFTLWVGDPDRDEVDCVSSFTWDSIPLARREASGGYGSR